MKRFWKFNKLIKEVLCLEPFHKKTFLVIIIYSNSLATIENTFLFINKIYIFKILIYFQIIR